MKRSEMLAKIAVQILEDDTNEEIHGEGKEMSYEQMARIALEVCEKAGMLPPFNNEIFQNNCKLLQEPHGNEWEKE